MDAFLLLVLIMLALLSLLVGGFAFLLMQRQPFWSTSTFRLPDCMRLKIDLGRDDLDPI